MTMRKQPIPQNSDATLAELLAWLDDFQKRSEHFDDATPEKVWELALPALALKTALGGSTASPEFRENATTNLRRFVRELQELDSAARAHTRNGDKTKPT